MPRLLVLLACSLAALAAALPALAHDLAHDEDVHVAGAATGVPWPLLLAGGAALVLAFGLVLASWAAAARATRPTAAAPTGRASREEGAGGGS